MRGIGSVCSRKPTSSAPKTTKPETVATQGTCNQTFTRTPSVAAVRPGIAGMASTWAATACQPCVRSTSIARDNLAT